MAALSKAIVLAAGRGTRMGALTHDLPKPMLPLAGKPMIEHILDRLRSAGVMEVLIVTGFRAETIEEHLQGYPLAITYVRQQSINGTGTAALLARDFAGSDPVLLTFGDIICESTDYGGISARLLSSGDTERKPPTEPRPLGSRHLTASPPTEPRPLGSRHFLASLDEAEANPPTEPRPFFASARGSGHFRASLNGAVLGVKRVDDPWQGAAVYEEQGVVRRIVEKPAKGTSSTHWNSAGLYAFRPAIFDFLAALQPSPRGEYELTSAVAAMIESDWRVLLYEITGEWRDVGRPEDLAVAEDIVD